MNDFVFSYKDGKVETVSFSVYMIHSALNIKIATPREVNQISKIQSIARALGTDLHASLFLQPRW